MIGIDQLQEWCTNHCSALTLLWIYYIYSVLKETAITLFEESGQLQQFPIQSLLYLFQDNSCVLFFRLHIKIIVFLSSEFLEKCLEMYQSMIQTHSSPRNPVVVPSGTGETKIHTSNHLPGDGVDAMQYFRAVYPLCDRVSYR